MKKFATCVLFSLAMSACAGVLCGCSPRVHTSLQGQYPARSADSVRVYGLGETPPAMAETVGYIDVTDAGLTTQCRYPQVLKKAVERTAACGGNALSITQHMKPDFWSSCHRISGTMLLVPDSVVTASSHEEIQRMEVLQDEAVANRKLEEQKTVVRPQDMFRLAIGPTWISSKVYITPQKYYKNRHATDICADYEHLWTSGLGLGVNFSHNHASFDRYGSFTQLYLGPSLVYAIRKVRHVGIECALGLGYSFYAEKGGYTDGGLGIMYKLGVEYLFTEHFGVGLQYNSWSNYYSKPDDFELSKDEEYRLDRWGFQLGVHYYF